MRRQAAMPVIDFKITVLDSVIDRRRIRMPPSPSGLAKNFILTPLALCPAAFF
jgi:hypothetical protein